MFKVLSGVCEDRADAVLLMVESKNLRGVGLRYTVSVSDPNAKNEDPNPTFDDAANTLKIRSKIVNVS